MSSSQWSALYSAESKYSLVVSRSETQNRLLIYCQTGLVLFALVALLIFNIASLLIAVTCLFSLLVVLDTKPNSVSLIELYADRQVSCGNGEKQLLHANSRVGSLGCWLVLIANEGGVAKSSNETVSRLFLFKDQFSAKDYSRLCRYIMKGIQTR